MADVIRLKNVSKYYGEGENQIKALDDVSLVIKEGEFVAIIGPSGSGKSTLMNILGCLDTPSKGEYFLDDILVSSLSEDSLAKIRNKKLGFVFQSFNLLPRTKAIDNVSMPLIYAGVAKKEREERAEKILEKLGLKDKLNNVPSKLSGGQQQRVAIARSLVGEPLILFADEPTGNLDSKSSSEIVEIFRSLNKEGKTIVMITHETDVAQIAKRIITVRDGKIISDNRNNNPKKSVSKNKGL